MLRKKLHFSLVPGADGKLRSSDPEGIVGHAPWHEINPKRRWVNGDIEDAGAQANLLSRLITIYVSACPGDPVKYRGSGFIVGNGVLTRKGGLRQPVYIACTAAHVLLDAHTEIDPHYDNRRVRPIDPLDPERHNRLAIEQLRELVEKQQLSASTNNADGTGDSMPILAWSLNSDLDVALVAVASSGAKPTMSINSDVLAPKAPVLIVGCKLTVESQTAKKIDARIELIQRGANITRLAGRGTYKKTPRIYQTTAPVPGGVSGGPVFACMPAAHADDKNRFQIQTAVVGVFSRDLENDDIKMRADTTKAGHSYIVPILYLYRLSQNFRAALLDQGTKWKTLKFAAASKSG